MSALVNGSTPINGVAHPIPLVPLDGLATRTQRLISGAIEDLRAQVAAEQQGRAEFERLVKESKAREAQMVKALQALEAQATPAAPKPVKVPKRPSHGRDPHPERHRTPSEAKLIATWQAILRYVDEHDKRFTASGIANVTPGLSPNTALLSLEVFRDHELIRPAGRYRGGQRYKLMPNVEFEGIRMLPAGAPDAA